MAREAGIGYELSRTYPVPRETLFGALTSAAVLKQIWGVQEIVVDARAGGRTIATFLVGDEDWSFTITYLEVVPPERLKWITHFKAFPAKETRVTILLTSSSAGTEFTLRMHNFESIEERDANRQAWERGLAVLAGLCSADC